MYLRHEFIAAISRERPKCKCKLYATTDVYISYRAAYLWVYTYILTAWPYSDSDSDSECSGAL